MDLSCDHCGAPLDPSWVFCGACGAPRAQGTADLAEVVPLGHTLDQTMHSHPATAALRVDASAAVDQVITAADADDHATARTRGIVRRHARLIAVAAVIALLVAVVAANEIGTHHRLATTRNELASTAANLASTQTELKATSSSLEETKSELDSTTNERDSLRSEVESKDTELQGVRGSLSDAQNRISLQSGQIASLKSCLSGVLNALSYAADGYYSAAVGSLEAVQVSCRDANSAL